MASNPQTGPVATSMRSRFATRATALAIGALLAAGVSGVVLANLPSDSTFKLDGTWNGGGTGTDWSNASGVVTFTDGTGSGDDIFWTGGSKDVRQIEDWRWKTGPAPSQKTDLLNVSVRTATEGGDLIAYFAARRLSSVGNAKIGFWILQDAVGPVSDTATTGHFSGSHEDGDILVDVDWTTGSVKTSGLRAYEWDGDATDNGPRRLTAHELPAGTFGDCKSVNRSNATVCVTTNTTTISSPWGNLAPGTFIEGAVNLTDAFGITALGCRPTILAETRSSGSSVMSELEDFVGASLSNCSLTVRKSATDDTNASFDFTTGGPSFTPASFSLKDQQYRTWSGLDNAAYSVTEAEKAGWALTSLTCTNTGNAVVTTNGRTVTADFSGDKVGRVDCTYVNRKLPRITLVKDVVPNDANAQFAFLLNGETKTTTATDGTSWGPYYLTAGSSPTVSETDGSGAVDLSTYTTSILCTKPGNANFASATNLTGATRSLALPTVGYNDAITCTFTNTKIPYIRLTKVLDPTTDTGTFYLTLDSAASGPIQFGPYGHNGTTGWIQADATTYTIGEGTANSTILADYTTGISCSKNGAAAEAYPVTATATYRRTSFVVSAGDTWDCFFTNTKLPKVTIQKVSTGSTGAFHWDITGGNGLPSTLDLTTLTKGVMVSGPTWTLTRTDGTYTLTEALTPGFINTDITCGNAVSVTIDDVNRQVTITDPGAGAVITCLFTNSGPFSTRTQGFWSTHPEIAWKVWMGDASTWPLMQYWTPMTTGDRTFCQGEELMTFDKTVARNDIPHDDPVLGGFWSDISKKTSGGSRLSIDQARMRLAQQLLAAVLNHHLFGSSPTGAYSIADAKAAFCGSDASKIDGAASAMAYFNENGDSGILTPGGSAKPRWAYWWADRGLWDTPTDF